MTRSEIRKELSRLIVAERLADQEADDLMLAQRRIERGRPLEIGQRAPAPGEIEALRSKAASLRQQITQLNQQWMEAAV